MTFHTTTQKQNAVGYYVARHGLTWSEASLVVQNLIEMDMPLIQRVEYKAHLVVQKGREHGHREWTEELTFL